MSTFKNKIELKYWWMDYGLLGHENYRFDLKDVMPYYDIYSDGTIIIYIKIKRIIWFAPWKKIEKIIDVHEDSITITKHEVPERRKCER